MLSVFGVCLTCIFFFNDTATTEIYTLSLHDALPICGGVPAGVAGRPRAHAGRAARRVRAGLDRKSTRLNSSHSQISYAVFCLKKKKTLSVGPLTTCSARAGRAMQCHSTTVIHPSQLY